MRRKTEANREATRIFFRPDLTKAQQEVDMKLREELTVAGKDKFMIRRGRIIPRNETIPKTVSSETTANSFVLLSEKFHPSTPSPPSSDTVVKTSSSVSERTTSRSIPVTTPVLTSPSPPAARPTDSV